MEMDDRAGMHKDMHKRGVEIVVYTRNLKIEGTMFLVTQERLTDFMARQSMVLPLVDVTVSHLFEDRILSKVKYLCLNKSEVQLVYPVEETIE
jgi:hypothetical protein